MTTKILEPELLVNDSNGIYIPQAFCKTYYSYITNLDEVREDFDICVKGPDEEFYWEAWENLMENMKFTNDNNESFTVGYLPESSDLWAIPENYEYPE